MYNKSHCLPFGTSTFTCRQPLDLIYTDVRGPIPITSLDDYRYYVIFVNYFTKCIWFYPFKLKYDMLTIFPNFKLMMEKYFHLPIVTIYSDGGDEYEVLKQTFLTLEVQHLISPPHTPQLISTVEHHHCYIVEIGLTLLHQASLPLSLCLSNNSLPHLSLARPTPILQCLSPFEKLFSQSPNYLKLRVFGCLYYPYLCPYTKHKLEPCSTLCVSRLPHHSQLLSVF